MPRTRAYGGDMASRMTPQQRLVVSIAVLGSFVAFLDGTVVNVALPAIARDLGGGLSTQQWAVDAYLVTLGALIGVQIIGLIVCVYFVVALLVGD